MLIDSEAWVYLTRTNLHGNSASLNGGGIANEGWLRLDRCNVENNTAHSGGGGNNLNFSGGGIVNFSSAYLESTAARSRITGPEGRHPDLSQQPNANDKQYSQRQLWKLAKGGKGDGRTFNPKE